MFWHRNIQEVVRRQAWRDSNTLLQQGEGKWLATSSCKERPAHTATYWVPEDGRRKMGSPKKTWRSTFKEDLEEMGVRGFAKKKIPKIRDYYGSWWVGPGLTRNLFFLGKSSQNALNQYWNFGVVYHVYSVCTLLKVVGYYDLSVLSMSVMGFQKKFGWGGGWLGWALSKFFGDFWNFFNFAKPLSWREQ